MFYPDESVRAVVEMLGIGYVAEHLQDDEAIVITKHRGDGFPSATWILLGRDVPGPKLYEAITGLPWSLEEAIQAGTGDAWLDEHVDSIEPSIISWGGSPSFNILLKGGRKLAYTFENVYGVRSAEGLHGPERLQLLLAVESVVGFSRTAEELKNFFRAILKKDGARGYLSDRYSVVVHEGRTALIDSDGNRVAWTSAPGSWHGDRHVLMVIWAHGGQEFLDSLAT